VLLSSLLQQTDVFRRLNDGLTYTGDMGPVTGNASGKRTPEQRSLYSALNDKRGRKGKKRNLKKSK
jgi:hypothetical protein